MRTLRGRLLSNIAYSARHPAPLAPSDVEGRLVVATNRHAPATDSFRKYTLSAPSGATRQLSPNDTASDASGMFAQPVTSVRRAAPSSGTPDTASSTSAGLP